MSRNEHDRRNEVGGLGFAVVAGACFGTVSIFAKFAFRDGADPLPLLAVRFAITSVALVLIHSITRRSLRVPASTALKLLALGAFGYGVEASLFFFALDHAPAGIVTLIFYSYPLLTTVFALATGLERFQPQVIAALLLGSLGVAAIFSVEVGELLGPLLALAAAGMVAVYFVLAQVVAKDVEPGAAATWTAVGAAVALSAAFALTDAHFPVAALGPAIALGLATAFAFVTMYTAIARLGSARVAIASMTEPVATLILAAIFLNEDITLRVVVGASLIVAALPVLVSRGRDKTASPMAPDTV